MNTPYPRISVFIPAHNEEKYIGACLDSLLRQTASCYEIIVVDNASTDRTAEIVQTYKSVKLIHQPIPGILTTRSTGFTVAQGDVVARLDADCQADRQWVQRIQQHFSNPKLAAISGPFYYYDMPAQRVVKAVEAWVRRELDRYSKNARFLAGANMAVRKEVWDAVVTHLCQDDTIHEDLDIAIHLKRLHYQIRFDPKLAVGTSARRVDNGLTSFYRYMRVYEHTFNSHGIHSAVLKVPIMVYFPLYPVLKLVRTFYDEETHRLSIRQLLSTDTSQRTGAKQVVRHDK